MARRKWTEEDRAYIVVTWERSDRKVRRALRRMPNVPRTTVRRIVSEYKETPEKFDLAKVDAARAAQAKRLRDIIELTTERILQEIPNADIRDLNGTLKIASTELALLEGRATSRTETTHAIDPASVQKSVQGAIEQIFVQTSERQQIVASIEDYVDGEVVEEKE